MKIKFYKMKRFLLRLVFINRRLILFLIFSMTLLLFYYNIVFINNYSPVPPYKTKCDIDAAKYLIMSLCDLYKTPNNDLVVGNMCESLCNKKNKFEYYLDYRLVDCLNEKPPNNNGLGNMYDEYKVVLIYERYSSLNNDNNLPKRIVLKSRKKYFLSYDVFMDFDFKVKPIFEQLKFLANHFKLTLENRYGIKLSYETIKWLKNYIKNPELSVDILKQNVTEKDLFYYVKLFSTNSYDFENALKNKDKQLLNNFITNLIILMSQDEYLFYRFFNLKPGSLKIYGSCGHFYGVEYAQSLKNKLDYLNFEERKSLALKFIELAHKLDTVYLFDDKNNKKDEKQRSFEEMFDEINYHDEKTNNQLNAIESIPIQICDVKLDNFGLNEKNELMIIDTDMVHPDKYIFLPKVCQKHEDCSYFDCKSFCDPTNKHCITKRINNNLQSICQNILSNSFEEDGVLSGIKNLFPSNLKYELFRKLKLCKNPGNSIFNVYYKSSLNKEKQFIFQKKFSIGFYSVSSIKIGANDTLRRWFEILLKDKNKIKDLNKKE